VCWLFGCCGAQVVSYTTALDMCNATGDWSTAAQLLREAEGAAVPMGTLGYSKAISTAAHAGKVRRVQLACLQTLLARKQ
jgi:hypothetical protein